MASTTVRTGQNRYAETVGDGDAGAEAVGTQLNQAAFSVQLCNFFLPVRIYTSLPRSSQERSCSPKGLICSGRGVPRRR